MTEAEIEEVIDGFVAAAGRAQASRLRRHRAVRRLPRARRPVLDAVVEPARPTSGAARFENRMRFSSDDPRAASASAAATTSSSGWRSASIPSPGVTLSVEELQEIVAWHDERRLMDYVTCGTGSYFDFDEIIPTSLYRAAARRAVRGGAQGGRPARAGPGREPHPHARGGRGGPRRRSADIVSIVRGQIADPHLVAKARDGRADEVRPCISCNQLCWGRRSRDYWISCLVNPSAGREFEWGGDRVRRRPTAPEARAGRRRRTGRARGGPGRGGARPPRHPGRARAAARRPVPARRPAAVARPDRATCSSGTSGS